MFHLLQTVSNNSVGLDVGVPARGLHGEAYRGHIFWDELFIVPSSTCGCRSSPGRCCCTATAVSTRPRLSAVAAGFTGAMFPWQSASSGREETQTMHSTPMSGRWLADASHLSASCQCRDRAQHLALLPGDG